MYEDRSVLSYSFPLYPYNNMLCYKGKGFIYLFILSKISVDIPVSLSTQNPLAPPSQALRLQPYTMTPGSKCRVFRCPDILTQERGLFLCFEHDTCL